MTFVGIPTDNMLSILEGRFPLRSEWPIIVIAHPPPNFLSTGLRCMPEMFICALTYPSFSGYIPLGGDIVDINMLPSGSSLLDEHMMKSRGDVGQIAL